MTDETLFLVLLILGMALINLALRWPIYLFAGRLRFSPAIERALGFVPVAVLSAIVFPAVLAPGRDSALALAWNTPYLIGALLAAFVSWRSRRLLPAIAIGMGGFFLARWLIG